MEIEKNIKFILVVTLVSFFSGHLLNGLSVSPLPFSFESRDQKLISQISEMSDVKIENLSDSLEFPEVDFDFVKQASLSGEPKIFDVRSIDFQELLGTIPNSIPLPIDDFKEYYEKYGVSTIDKNEPIIVFCADIACPDSKKIAFALSNLGHKNVFVYAGGWDEWESLNE